MPYHNKKYKNMKCFEYSKKRNDRRAWKRNGLSEWEIRRAKLYAEEKEQIRLAKQATKNKDELALETIAMAVALSALMN